MAKNSKKLAKKVYPRFSARAIRLNMCKIGQWAVILHRLRQGLESSVWEGVRFVPVVNTLNVVNYGLDDNFKC